LLINVLLGSQIEVFRTDDASVAASHNQPDDADGPNTQRLSTAVQALNMKTNECA